MLRDIVCSEWSLGRSYAVVKVFQVVTRVLLGVLMVARSFLTKMLHDMMF